MIFILINQNRSGMIELEEVTEYLKGQYTREEIEILFGKMDQSSDGEISMDEFSQTMLVQLQSQTSTQKLAILVEDFHRRYFLNSVKQAYLPLGLIWRISQPIEMLCTFQRAYRLILTVFEMDHTAIKKLGVISISIHPLRYKWNNAWIKLPMQKKTKTSLLNNKKLLSPPNKSNPINKNFIMVIPVRC